MTALKGQVAQKACKEFVAKKNHRLEAAEYIIAKSVSSGQRQWEKRYKAWQMPPSQFELAKLHSYSPYEGSINTICTSFEIFCEP